MPLSLYINGSLHLDFETSLVPRPNSQQLIASELARGKKHQPPSEFGEINCVQAAGDGLSVKRHTPIRPMSIWTIHIEPHPPQGHTIYTRLHKSQIKKIEQNNISYSQNIHNRIDFIFRGKKYMI